MKRAHNGLPPVDEWNIGVEYEWDGMCFTSTLILTSLEDDLW